MIISLPEIAKYQLENGDLLFVRVNGNPNLVGRVAIFEEKTENVVFSDHIIRTKIDQELAEPLFVSNILNSPYGHRQTRNAVTTTAGQYTINRSGLSSIRIIYPPIAEQKKFVSVIN